MYNMSKHAEHRAVERRAPQVIVDLLLKFGHRRMADDGRSRVVLDKAGARKARKYLGQHGTALIDCARAFVLITDELNQMVVTVIPDQKKQQFRDQYRPWKLH